MTIEEILHVARETWGKQTGGMPELPESYEAAREHTSGCTLADWIVTELIEGTEAARVADPSASNEDVLSEAIRVLDVGARDLLAVVAALRAEELRRHIK